MDLSGKLAQERRGRLAAERLLEQRNRALEETRQKLRDQSLAFEALQRQMETQSQPPAPARAAHGAGRMASRQPQHSLPEMAAAQSPPLLQACLDSLTMGVAIFDPQTRLIGANRPLLRLWQQVGHSARPAMGTLYEDILRPFLAQGLIATDELTEVEWLSQMLSALDQDVIAPRILRFGNGRVFRLHQTRLKTGELVVQVTSMTDQMRIWPAIEAMPDGFVIFNAEDRLVICNKSYRSMYPTAAPILQPGVAFEEILRHGLAHGEYPQATGREEEWLAMRLSEHREGKSAGEHQLKDGRWIRSFDKLTPDGGRVGLRVDITELRAQAEALETARMAAEAASRAKTAFLANMSHEIRTPLNGVVGMAELLCDTELVPEQRLFAETIRSSGEALLIIINDILDYSKIEAERLSLHPEPFDLERLLHEVVMLLQPRAQARGLELQIDYDVFLPTRFIGDPGRLRQVLVNLIGNAVKFTEVGHVLARVVGFALEDGRYQLHVTIEDTGIGIPAEQLDHIFGEFNQVEGAENRKYEGTGLGLAITRRLIERMEGAVWVDSELGKGAVFGFRVVLPIAEEGEVVRKHLTISKAMVVDDNFINRTILERQLGPWGMEVILCRSAEEALESIKAGVRPDILLTDHEMPDMDGITLACRLRERGFAAPILLLSSVPIAARERQGAMALDLILQKPVLRAELYAQIHDLTEAEAEAADTPPPLQEAGPPQTRMRVLAAEDNKTNQLVFQKMVRDLDLDLRFAANGREAVELWQEWRPDLIFMDISMPEIDGKEATRMIRLAEAASGFAPVPIIALTAHAMSGDGNAVLMAGMNHYLTKPLRKSEICAAIRDFGPAEFTAALRAEA